MEAFKKKKHDKTYGKFHILGGGGSEYFWYFKGEKMKSLRMSKKSFLDNKK